MFGRDRRLWLLPMHTPADREAMRSAFLDWSLPWPGHLVQPPSEGEEPFGPADEFTVEVESSSQALGDPEKYA